MRDQLKSNFWNCPHDTFINSTYFKVINADARKKLMGAEICCEYYTLTLKWITQNEVIPYLLNFVITRAFVEQHFC